MELFFYIDFGLLTLILVVHIVVIALSYRHRMKWRGKHQIHIISSLCLTKLNGYLIILTILITCRYLAYFISYLYFHCVLVCSPADELDYVSNVLFTLYFIWNSIYIVQVIATKTPKNQSNNKKHVTLLTPTLLIVEAAIGGVL